MKKQLIITLSFLLVSISVLGVASYAWYSNNTTVGASGISMSVVMPINIMASTSPDTPAALTSLAGFRTTFVFGSLTEEGGESTINEYDMLIPVSSADGINFAYLPFRYVAEGGYPKPGTALGNYRVVREPHNIGYFIDIPLYLTTTTARDLEVYVSHIDLSSYSGDGMHTRAVRCAIIKKEEGDVGYSTVITAKAENAAPLYSSSEGRFFYPMLPDLDEGGNLLGFIDAGGDTAAYKSSYYATHTGEDNPYVRSQSNIILLKSCESVGSVITYYTTETRIRIWIEGSDMNAVIDNEGKYFAVSVVLAVHED